MDLSFGPEYDDFRSDVVNFLNNNSDKAPKGGDLRGEQAKDWQKLLIENGYTCRTIPKEYGGFGAEPDIIKSRIIGEEFSCLLYTSPSPRDLSTSRMPSSA